MMVLRTLIGQLLFPNSKNLGIYFREDISCFAKYMSQGSDPEWRKRAAFIIRRSKKKLYFGEILNIDKEILNCVKDTENKLHPF